MAKKSRRQSGNPAARGQTGNQPRSQAGNQSRESRSARLARNAENAGQLPEGVPPNGASYPQILRGTSYAWWRSMLGVVFGLSLYLMMTAVITQVVVGMSWSITGAAGSFEDFSRRATAFELPAGMLAANLGIATLIPICWVLMTIVHQVRPRWLSSVQPRMRWKYLLISAGVAFVVLNAVTLIPLAFGGSDVKVSPQSGLWGFLIVIILTSPLQAAAEEYFFRGYLMQALGSLVAHPAFGVVVSALLFALMHGVQNPALFVNRLGFGLLAGILVWRTGGLEAGIGAHVVNNICAYLIAGLTSSMAALRAVDSITWVDSGIQLGGFAVFAALALWVARGLKLRTTVDLSLGR